MKLLLDTHIWLWMKDDKDRIPSPVRRRLSGDSVSLCLSAACVMEISIKLSVGKLRLDVPASELVDRLLSQGVIPARRPHRARPGRRHFATAPSRSLRPRLVAQARVEGLTLVTADARVLQYGVPTIDARK